MRQDQERASSKITPLLPLVCSSSDRWGHASTGRVTGRDAAGVAMAKASMIMSLLLGVMKHASAQ